MTGRPTRATVQGRAYLDVRNLARRDGRDPAEYLTLYALEALVARLADSDQRDDFVLKGGVLLAAYAARRPTRDIDLAARSVPNDMADVLDRIRAVSNTPREDGVTFRPDSWSAETIRDDAPYAGVRVSLVATIATARIPLHVDVNFGDPIWPAPTLVGFPLLLGGQLDLLGYAPETILAEKITTAIDRGTANTRWRDFVDIDAVTRTTTVDGLTLRKAIDTVAAYRQVRIRPLSEALDTMAPLAQTRWAAWRRKQRLEATAPPQFADLLERCFRFADPILNDPARSITWSPAAQSWE